MVRLVPNGNKHRQVNVRNVNLSKGLLFHVGTLQGWVDFDLDFPLPTFSPSLPNSRLPKQGLACSQLLQVPGVSEGPVQ